MSDVLTLALNPNLSVTVDPAAGIALAVDGRPDFQDANFAIQSDNHELAEDFDIKTGVF